MPNLPGNQDKAEGPDDVDDKLELAKFSYGEVLDATKHQDDKLGRMITSVAFLTAAALALAALGSAKFATRTFDVPPFKLPLALITFFVFLVGMMFTMLVLLGSLSTPLRLPGAGRSSGPRKRPASQLYFYSISRIPNRDWKKQWEAPAEELKRERLRNFISEIHNLGVRTSFKYDRSNEAVAILSFSLLLFVLAGTFIAIAAATGGDNSITLGKYHRVIVGLILGGYCYLQLLTRIRYDRQSIDDYISYLPKKKWRRILDANIFAIVFASFVMTSILSDQGWPREPGWLITVILLGLATTLLYFTSGKPSDLDKASPLDTDQASVEGQQVKLVRKKIITLAVPASTIFATVTITFSATNGWFGIQLLVAVSQVFVLNLVAALDPTIAIAEHRQLYMGN